MMKRYDPELECDPYHHENQWVVMEEETHGEWVRYDSYIEVREAMQLTIETMAKEIEHLARWKFDQEVLAMERRGR
jgi:hypothetical protein